MKNQGLDTHRSFNSSKYSSSRPSLYKHPQISGLYKVDHQYEKLQKMIPSTRKTQYKNSYDEEFISPNKLYESKYQKSNNKRIGDRRSIAKVTNHSQKILPRKDHNVPSYKGTVKWKYNVDQRARTDLEESGLSIPESFLSYSNVSLAKENHNLKAFQSYRYSKYHDKVNGDPSIVSVNGSDMRRDSAFMDQHFDRQTQPHLTKSSYNPISRNMNQDIKLISKQSDIDKYKDKKSHQGYISKTNHSTNINLYYPKIQNIQTERFHYETGFLKKNDDFTARSRKRTEIFELPELYKQEHKSLKIIPKSQKIEDLKYDISNLSTRHTSLYIPAERKLSIMDFDIGKCLGHGRFGKVYHAIHKDTGVVVALKKITKENIKLHKLQNQLTLQIKIQMYLDHPNIVKMYGVINQKESIYLILQHMEQGSLYQSLKKRGKLLSESQVAKIIKETVSSIKYLHDLSVVHRDIKPQNILISNGICKLADFGWATVCNQRRKTNCGTLDYYAPQILEGEGYNQSIDLWCIGVLTFELLTGKVPFYHASKKQTVNKIIRVEKMDFPSRISQEARNFTQSLLVKQPSKRLSVNKLLSHSFITKNCLHEF